MTKADIANMIQSTIGLSRNESHDMLEAILSIIKDILRLVRRLR